MKAIVLTEYGPPDGLQYTEVEKPAPKDGEVLVKVHAASVNDWDWSIVRGKPSYIRLLCGLLKPNVRIPGVDIAGRVEAIGGNVKTFKPGDEVYGDLSECGFGGFAEYVCAPTHALVRKPAGMTFAEAAALPHAAALALQGLYDEGHLQPGQTLLINGAGGGVGTLGVQIAKTIGVEATGVDHADKLDMMRSVGFDQVVDYTREDFTRSGRRYDLILDTKTSRSLFDFARALNPNGRYVTVGGTPGRLIQTLISGPVLHIFTKKQRRIVALKTNKGLEGVNALFEAGKIKPVLDGPYPLAETPEAIRRFGAGRHRGKVIITVSNDA